MRDILNLAKSIVQMLLQISETWVPNLWEDNPSFVNISTEEKARTNFIENLKTRYDRATVGMNTLFKRIKPKEKKEEEERTFPQKLFYDSKVTEHN